MVMSSGQPRRRFALRLDDGTLLSSNSRHTGGKAVAVLLKPAQAYEAGHLHEAELIRLQALLCEVHARLPEHGPLKSVSTGTKRSLDSVLEVGQAISGKRSRSTGVVAPGNGYHADTAAAPGIESPPSVPVPLAAAPSLPPAPDAGVTPFGLSTLGKLVKILGKEAFIFTDPVNAQFVPDYYDIIKNPICLNEVRGRLQQGAYASMATFYEDMYLMLSNCYTYNKIGTHVYLLGQKLEKLLHSELRKAGHGHLVRNIKRQTRGPARGGLRLDDDEEDDDYRPAPAKRAGSQRIAAPAPKAKSHRPAAPRPQAKAPGAVGVARTKSVNSYKAFQPLPEDKQAALAEALSNEETLMEKMEGVVEILQRAGELGASEDGEVELDLTVLSPQTVWQLYEFIFGAQQQQQAARSGSGFQLEQDSDYDPEEEDDE